MEGMLKCSANYVPLTPISFLERSAIVYRDCVSIVNGDVKYTWRETHERCIRLASALAGLGISRGDVVTHHSLILSLSSLLGFCFFKAFLLWSKGFICLVPWNVNLLRKVLIWGCVWRRQLVTSVFRSLSCRIYYFIS